MYMYIMVEGKGLSRILSREIVAWVGTRADVCALIGTPVRIQPVYVYTTIHTYIFEPSLLASSEYYCYHRAPRGGRLVLPDNTRRTLTHQTHIDEHMCVWSMGTLYTCTCTRASIHT